MTVNVTSDRRVTVPILGLHTAFVDGSRLFWALPSPVHEGLGYRVLIPDRIQGDAVLPHSSFTALPASRFAANRPDPPASRRARSPQGVAWQSRSLPHAPRATASLDEGCARRSGRIMVGTKKHALSRTKKLTALADSVHRHACLLTPSLIQGWVSHPTLRPFNRTRRRQP